jgi:PEP-CTERM motif
MILRRWSCALALVVSISFATISSAALPGWYDAVAGKGIKPDLPDLYQHEFLTGLPAVAPIPKKAGWEVGGGWCRPTAMVDGLYSLQAAGYGGLLPAGSDAAATWLDKTGDAIKNLRNVQGTGIQGYLASTNHGVNQGVGPGKGLVFNQFYVNPINGVVSYVSAYNRLMPLTVKNGPNTVRPETAFEVYQAAMFQDQDVMVRIGDVQNYGPGGKIPLHWWAGPQPLGGNYHYLNGAGIDTTNNTMFLADPDSNKGSADANAGWGPNFNADPNVAARRYAAADPIPIPARGANPDDMPANFGNFYSSVSVAGNGYVFAPQGNRYSGAFIQAIEAIGPLRAFKRFAIPAAARLMAAGSAAGVAPVPELIDIDSNISDLVDKIEIFPTSSPVTGFADTFSDDDSWTEADIAPNALDPFGDARDFGGFEFDVTPNADADPDGLEAGEMATASIETAGDFTAFDIMMHDAITDTWSVQAVGAHEDLATDQAPEPATITLLAIGVALACVAKRKHRNRSLTSF